MIIIVDLDHTLLNEEGKLTEKTVSYFKNLDKTKHKVIINSARSLIRSVPFAKAINADYINCFYGNLVVDSNNNIIFSRGLNNKDFASLVAEYKEIFKGWIGVETVYGAYGTEPKICKTIGAEVKSEKEILNYDALKIIFECASDKDQEMRKKASELAEKYNLEINFARENFFCSFLPKGTNKWNGLKIILEKIGTKFGKTVAFGDEKTDLKTFENVEIPVAMANSTKEVLEKINNVTKCNNDDGVVSWLEQNI